MYIDFLVLGGNIVDSSFKWIVLPRFLLFITTLDVIVPIEKNVIVVWECFQ